ncbi:hypothetical protein BBG47_09235 [Paenibacillus sp. KS1]|nr:hypothetical protein BBG47_09235 [Paenibacillus sp. KS1]
MDGLIITSAFIILLLLVMQLIRFRGINRSNVTMSLFGIIVIVARPSFRVEYPVLFYILYTSYVVIGVIMFFVFLRGKRDR